MKSKHGSPIYMHGTWGTSNKNGGVQLDLAFVFRGKNTPFFCTSVNLDSMIDNSVLKLQYIWTLKKTKYYSSVEK
jgi:hypothetical protein